MVVAIDNTVTVLRLSDDVELDHRVGELISDGADGHWHVEAVMLDERCLVVSVVGREEPSVTVLELLAA
jgi:hypothetical protein